MTLKQVLKLKILDSLRKVNGFKLLVVDPESLKVLDSTCKMTEILNENVLAVEAIFKNRKPQPEKVAVYLISSSLTSVQALVGDFAKRPMYKVCHVFCLSPLPDSLFEMIKTSNVKRYIGNLVELNIDFTAPDPGFFCLDIPESYYSIYGSSAESLLDYELQNMAQKLVTVLQNLGEYPHIRYSTKPQAFSTSPQKSLSYRLASLLDSELTRLCRADTSFPPISPYERGILIITDRTIDIISCLLHDVHYQSIISDLLPFHKQKYTDQEGKEYILDETDLIYKYARTLHIGLVTEYVQDKLETFTNTNEAAKFEINGSSGAEIEQLKGVMESFQDYSTTKEMLARHVNICLRVSRIYQSRGLERIVELEQDLVTVSKGDRNWKRVLKDVDLVLVDSSVEYGFIDSRYFDKIRLLFLLVLAQEGVSDTDRANLLELARCDMAEIQALTNLGMLSVRLSPSQDRKTDSNPYGISQISKRNSRKPVAFENDKWLPTLSFVIEDQINNQLDTNWFPWLKEPPANLGTVQRPAMASDNSSGFGKLFKKKEEAPVLLQPTTRKKPSWATRKSGQSQNSDTPSAFNLTSPTLETPQTVDLRQNGPRVMVFMIGGATFSELRSVSDLEQKFGREILLGSTHTWTPDGFVASLKDLSKKNVQGSKFYGFQRPVDTRIKQSVSDDVPERPRARTRPRDGSGGEIPPRPRPRDGPGDEIPQRPTERSSGRERAPDLPPRNRRNSPPRERRSDSSSRRSPPGTPPRRPSANSRTRPDQIYEEFDRMNVQSNSYSPGRRDERNEKGGAKEEKKRGWF